MGHRLAFSLVTDPGGPGGPAAGPSCMCDTQAPSSLSHVPPGDGHTHRAARTQKQRPKVSPQNHPGLRPLPHFQEVFEVSLVRH